jgi:GH25 family lysozyme M1 (1,4-beta-N-acetylmuramidase)
MKKQKQRKRKTAHRNTRKGWKWNDRLLWLIPAALLVTAVVLAVQSYNAIEVTTDVAYTIVNDRPVNYYDMDLITFTDGKAAYEDDNYTSRLGVDVSYYNKNVNFTALKKAGVSFVMVRCGYRGYTEGSLNEDEKFKEYIEAAQDAGLDVGVYFFSQAVDEEEAAEEAKFVLTLIRDYDITMPVAYDYEMIADAPDARGNLISIQQRTNNAVVFAENIKNAGYTPMIYASTDTYDDLYNAAYLTEYQTWIAQYDETNTYEYAYTMWQYTDQGVDGSVLDGLDLDIQFIRKTDSEASASSSASAASPETSASAESTASPEASAS